MPPIKTTSTPQTVLQSDFPNIVDSAGATEVGVVRDADGKLRFYVGTLNAESIPDNALDGAKLTDQTIDEDKATAEVLNDHDQRWQWYSDYLTTTAAANGWSSTVSGSGAGFADAWPIMTSSTKLIGVMELETGTTSTGICALQTGGDTWHTSSADTAISAEFAVSVSALSTAAQEFKVRVGMGRTWWLSSEPTEGAYFRYDRATDGDFWTCVVRRAGSESKVITAVAPGIGAAMDVLRVEMSADGSAFTFFIDGTQVASFTSASHNTPVARIAMGLGIYKTAGTTTRMAYIDYHDFRFSQTTARF